MAKGKAKNNSSDSLVPPQTRSLRSRKRGCPSDEISETDDVQAPLHHQDPERTNSAEDATLLQCKQSPLQESTMTSAQQHQAAEQSCFIKQDPATEEENVEATNDKAIEAEEETTVTNPNSDSDSDRNSDSEPQGFREQTDDDANRSGKDEEKITTDECNRSQSQTCTDQLLSPTSEKGDLSLATALEEQVGSTENSQIEQETSPEEHSSVYMTDVKEVTKEAPAKKKRRMGMCGLTEKERSHFLQTQKRENGKNGLDRAEKQICNNSADLVAQEDIKSAPHLPSSLSILGGSITEQKEAEKTFQSSHCGGNDRAEKEVHSAVTTSDGTSTECEPGCSKHKSCETERGPAPDPEQPGDMKSDQPAEEEVLGSQEKQEQTAKSIAEKPQEQMKDGGDASAVVNPSPAVSFYCNPTQNDEPEDQDAIEAASPQVNSVTKTRDERKEELTCDAGDGDRAEAGASPTHTMSGGFNGGSVELCQAAVSPSGSERKNSCDPDDEPGVGLSTVNAEHPQTKDTEDSIGSWTYLDYLSDSQLNTIALIEEEVMELEEDCVSPDCHDATDLICGLIRELSSLNQKVMATHREWENLRRSSKTSRSSKL